MLYILFSINIRSGRQQILGGFTSLENAQKAWKAVSEAETGFQFYSIEECHIHADISQKFRVEPNARNPETPPKVSDFPF